MIVIVQAIISHWTYEIGRSHKFHDNVSFQNVNPNVSCAAILFYFILFFKYLNQPTKSNIYVFPTIILENIKL